MIGGAGQAVVQTTLAIAGAELELEMSMPGVPLRPRQLMPIFRRLTESVIQLSVDAVKSSGEAVSCRAGCGACCRQAVPLAELEARDIADLVSELPEPRRTVVRARFAGALERLESTGLLSKLTDLGSLTPEVRQGLGVEYFRLGIPCPFLEQESCSIYPDRPLACREYLVTSPAINCATPSAETVRVVPLAGRVSTAVASLAGPQVGHVPWVPLVLAPAWAEEHPDDETARPGPEIVHEVLDRLAGKGLVRSF